MISQRSCLALLLCLTAARAGAQDLAELKARLASNPGGTRFTALVVDEASGAVLLGHAQDTALVPASNMKVLTTAAAWSRLGPTFAHETRVMAAGAPVDGVISGDVVVVGDGDPTISRRFDPEPLLSDWAEALWRAGVRKVTGGVVADARAFDDVRLHPDWEPSDAERWYGAEISALTLNDGCIDVNVAGSPGGARVTLSPDTGYFTVEVAAGLTEDKNKHVFSVLRAGPDKRQLRITGRVWTRAPGYESSVPARDPAMFFAVLLRERLVARGIEVVGPARRAAAGDAANGAFTLHRRLAPLPRTLEVTNRRSQNMYAECLAKTLGRRHGGGGTWAAAGEVIAAHARASGAEADEVVVRDGSGLSRENRLSAAALVAVLRAASRGPEGAAFRSTFAEPGADDGTLEKRLRDLPAGAALRAKTGTLTGVSALSGYLTVGQRRVVFAVIGNGGGGGKDVIDAVVKGVARHLSQ